MLRSSPSSSRVTLPLLSRCLSTTPSACESMAATREKYESKYAERLRAKARAEGLGEDVAGLKERAKREGKLTPRMKELVSRKPGQGEEAATTSLGTEAKKREKPVFAPAKPKSPSSSRVGTSSERRDKSPIKVRPAPACLYFSSYRPTDMLACFNVLQPLDEIVDLAKLISEPSVERIAQIWNGYHQSLSATPALSAVIPYETYLKMAEMGSRYPSFVVPLPREVQPEQGEGQSLPEMKDKKQVGAEMHFLVSHPWESGRSWHLRREAPQGDQAGGERRKQGDELVARSCSAQLRRVQLFSAARVELVICLPFFASTMQARTLLLIDFLVVIPFLCPLPSHPSRFARVTIYLDVAAMGLPPLSARVRSPAELDGLIHPTCAIQVSVNVRSAAPDPYALRGPGTYARSRPHARRHHARRLDESRGWTGAHAQIAAVLSGKQ